MNAFALRRHILLQVAQDPVASATFSALDAQFANVVDTTGP